jgi:exonuclease-1
MLLKTCILSGCDYLQSIKGIAFKKALKLMKDYEGNIEAIMHSINSPARYLHDFNKAFLTFKHQVIYDFKNKKQRYLN